MISTEKLEWMKSVGIVPIPADVFFEQSTQWPGVDLHKLDFYRIKHGQYIFYSYNYISNTPLETLKRRGLLL